MTSEAEFKSKKTREAEFKSKKHEKNSIETFAGHFNLDKNAEKESNDVNNKSKANRLKDIFSSSSVKSDNFYMEDTLVYKLTLAAVWLLTAVTRLYNINRPTHIWLAFLAVRL